MPKVSVIIPTYKHRDFVLATLDSVFAQTFTDYEVIVINDGSPDDTAEVLRPLAESGRIRYMEQKNTGQSQARNVGIAKAHGEFIALLDDDDLWPPDKLEWQVAALENNPDVAVVAGPADVIDATGRFIEKTYFAAEISFEQTFEGSPFISPGQTLIRSGLLKAIEGFNTDIWGTDDWDLWLRLVKHHRVVMEDRTALLYRRHAGNASNNLCRMLDNCLRVVHIHLPSVPVARRESVRHKAYLWLYHYLGWPMAREMKRLLRSGRVGSLPAYGSRLARLGKVLVTDATARRHVAVDFMPHRLSSRLFSKGSL